jgi:hypothetical protein
MATNQELRHASVCEALGTTPGTDSGDWMALFDAANIPEGPFNGRFLAWINGQLDTAYDNLPGAMQAYAVAMGAPSWDALGTFTVDDDQFRVTQDGEFRVTQDGDNRVLE